MVIFRFKDSEEHEDLLKKVRRMKRFAAEIEECLMEHMEDEDTSYRHNGNHHEDDDYDDEELKKLMNRYSKLKRMGK